MESESLEAMRARLQELKAIQQAMRADLKPILARAAAADRAFERALARGNPQPPDDSGPEASAAMRRLSGVNKEILRLMDAIEAAEAGSGGSG